MPSDLCYVCVSFYANICKQLAKQQIKASSFYSQGSRSITLLYQIQLGSSAKCVPCISPITISEAVVNASIISPDVDNSKCSALNLFTFVLSMQKHQQTDLFFVFLNRFRYSTPVLDFQQFFPFWPFSFPNILHCQQ